MSVLEILLVVLAGDVIALVLVLVLLFAPAANRPTQRAECPPAIPARSEKPGSTHSGTPRISRADVEGAVGELLAEDGPTATITAIDYWLARSSSARHARRPGPERRTPA